MSSTATSTVPQKRLRLRGAAVAALLALALVCAQSLGLWHRLVHPGPSQLAGLNAARATGTDTAPAHGLLAHLFSQHAGEPDCQFFDHASLGDAMGSASTAAVALVLVPLLLAAGRGGFTARWHALFQARAPPSVR